MLISSVQWNQGFSGSETAVLKSIKQLLPDNPFFAYVAYPWAMAPCALQDMTELRHCISKSCAGSVVTYTDVQPGVTLLRQMASVGITDLFCANWALIPASGSCGVRIWSAPASPEPFTGQSWVFESDVRFGRVLSTDPAARLWYLLEHNIIPVLSLQKISLPGSALLWKQATVDCSENRTANAGIDDVIAKFAADKPVLEQKWAALNQLKFLYKADCFIYDILRYSVSDHHYASGKLSRIKRYINELRQTEEPTSRNTLLLLMKTEIVLLKELVARAFLISNVGLEFANVLATLSEQELNDMQSFAQKTKLTWLLEFINEV